MPKAKKSPKSSKKSAPAAVKKKAVAAKPPAKKTAAKPIAKKPVAGIAKTKVQDYDFCEHSEDKNGFVTCYGSDCEKGKSCTLQRRLIGKDPWHDVPDGENNVKDPSNAKYEFRCVCV